MKDNLVEIIRSKALKIADKNDPFILPSGRRSIFYLDHRKLTLDPYGALLIGNSIIELLRNRWEDIPYIQAVGGHDSSIVTATILASLSSMKSRAVTSGPEYNMNPMNGFVVRKTANEYGRYIEGSAVPDTRAVLVESVTSTGQRALDSAQKATSFGLEVVAIISVMDRNEGAQDNIEENRYDFHPIITTDDIGISENGACFVKTESEKVRRGKTPEWLKES